MRVFHLFPLLICLSACGPADSTPSVTDTVAGEQPDQISEAVAQSVEQAVKGDFGADEVSEDSCAGFENGLVSDLFDVDTAQISYRRSIPVKRAGHVVCLATWERPDRAELESAYMEEIQEWTRGKTTGKKDPMPKPARLDNTVSITLLATQFDSADAAVTSLENAVAALEKGVTTNVGGKDYTAQHDFGDWIDNLGDKAIFNETGELLVAYKGKRFSVNVRVSDDPAEDRSKAIELAKRLM